MSGGRSGESCLKLSLSIFLRLEHARGSSGGLELTRPLRRCMAAREDGRRAESTSVHRGDNLWALRFWVKKARAPTAAIPKPGPSKALFLKDSVRHTPRPVQRKVRLIDDEVSNWDWVTRLCPVLAAPEVASD